MRLLNTKTLHFEEFFDDKIPQYAILSHRWRDEEVSYQDFLASRKRDGAGFQKILRACELAAENFSWIWIDTCCINKDSSNELSEAINSMWRWYRKADVCFAYLDDVPEKPFTESEWFTRGWTLQELLAPRQVEFLSKDWTRLGSRNELCKDISTATGIDWRMFSDTSTLYKCSAAVKLSWAANRCTSRVEDTAYCLLGLLDINMPLLYGEGEKAFMRLQEELLRSRGDESILTWSFTKQGSDTFALPPLSQSLNTAWTWSDPPDFPHLLAHSPSQFASCGNVVGFPQYHREPSQMTTTGLRMDAVLFAVTNSKDEFLAPLNCYNRDHHNLDTVPDAPLALHLTLYELERKLYRRTGCVDLARPEFAQIRSELKSRGKRSMIDVFPIKRRATLVLLLILNIVCTLIMSLAFHLSLGTCLWWYVFTIATLLVRYFPQNETQTIFILQDDRHEFDGGSAR